MKFGMNHLHDPALIPRAGNLERAGLISAPRCADLDVDEVTDACRSAACSDRSSEADSFIGKNLNRHHGRVARGHEGRF